MTSRVSDAKSRSDVERNERISTVAHGGSLWSSAYPEGRHVRFADSPVHWRRVTAAVAGTVLATAL